MHNAMKTVEQVTELIDQGAVLVLAGDHEVLRCLPAGRWIGGSTPYFMAEEGCICDRQRIHVTDLTDTLTDAKVCTYFGPDVARVYEQGVANGLSAIILPAGSATHLNFALNAPSFEHFGAVPLIGWIAGVHLDDLAETAASVFAGGREYTDAAVTLHGTLPEGRVAQLDILNRFEAKPEGDRIEFPQSGFSVHEAMVNGEKVNFSQYVRDSELDTRWPLVADYFGTAINVSFQHLAVDHVVFYAPVVAGVTYRHARPVDDHVEGIRQRVPNSQIAFSCNCILNYKYAGVEGHRTGNLTGPITFGEVGYQLLNQTLAYVTLYDIE